MTSSIDPRHEAAGTTLSGVQQTPETTESQWAVASWWTGERASLATWFERRAPALSPLYTAAVAMVHDECFPGRVRFVAHAVREIRNRLPEELAGKIEHRGQYRHFVEVIHKSWLEAGLPTDGSLPLETSSEPPSTGPAKMEVPETLLSAVGELVAAHVEAGETHREKARRMFEAVGEEAPPAYVLDNWLDSSKWSEKLVHVSKTVSVEDEERLAANFARFEQSLMAIANRTYENMDALDELLESANR